MATLQKEYNQAESESSLPSDEEQPPIMIDEDIGLLQFKFGYKSVLIRDQNDRYLFEIYLPTEIDKGLLKLEEYHKKIKKPKSFFEFKQRQIS